MRCFLIARAPPTTATQQPPGGATARCRSRAQLTISQQTCRRPGGMRCQRPHPTTRLAPPPPTPPPPAPPPIAPPLDGAAPARERASRPEELRENPRPSIEDALEIGHLLHRLKHKQGGVETGWGEERLAYRDRPSPPLHEGAVEWWSGGGVFGAKRSLLACSTTTYTTKNYKQHNKVE